jgi:hypothetical protein
MSIPTNTQTASSVFRQTHPLGFNLLDDDDQQVLFIADDPSGHNLRLEIHNTSQLEVALAKPASDLPGKDNYHFELRFRPGTLWQQEGIQLTAPEWKFAQDKTESHTSLYFLRPAPVTLAPDSRLTILLQNISADGRGGARGTRVELRYAQLNYPSDPSTDLTGSGIQHLSIINERGKRQVPLHVGFVGSNTILNDGSSLNERRLLITNILDVDIPLLDSKSAGDACSKLIVSFDISGGGSQKPWALMEKGQVPALGIEVTLNEWEVTGEDKLGDPPTWTICPKEGNVMLKAGGSVELKLSGLESSMPSGPANVYLRYENIPGYWDGEFDVTLDKGPIVVQDVLQSGSYLQRSNVGIGTADPKSSLHVAGSAQFDGNVGIGKPPSSAYKLDVEGGFLRAGHNSQLKAPEGTGAGGLALAWNRSGGSAEVNFYNLFNGSVPNPKSFQFSQITAQGTVDDQLTIERNGNVGIGTTAPNSARLDIRDQDTTVQIRKTMSTLVSGWNNGGAIYFGVDNANDPNAPTAAIETSWGNGAQPQIAIGVTRDFAGGVRANILLDYSGGIDLRQGKTSRLFVGGGGNVGIGTTNPVRPLEINNALKLTNSGSDANDGVIGTGTFAPGLNLVGIRTDNTYRKVGLWGEITQQQNDGTNTWQGNNYFSGNVSIGRRDPSAPLYVGISQRAPHHIDDQYAYVGYQWNRDRGNDFQWGLTDRGVPQYFDDTSILAEGRVICKALGAFSDARIKTNLRPSSKFDALNLLNQLKVTDYQFKDVLGHGPKYHQGFVAQEVERFLPQAVSQRSDFIPDIYALAEETAVDNGVLTVRLQDPHHLVEGDVVRLVTEGEGVKEVAVRVVDERTFAVKDWTAPPGSLFVHGKKVDDFRTLDYQQIFSLGISGIQQLSIEVNELKAANAKLRKRLQLLETKLQPSAPMVGVRASSNGNGSHPRARSVATRLKKVGGAKV